MRNYQRAKTACTGGIVMLALLFFDLLTKAIAEAVDFRQKSFFLGIIRLYYTENTGFAWGMGSDNRPLMIFVTAFTFVLILGIVVLFFTAFRRNKPAQMSLAVIEAGAIGNLVDRLVLTYVRDFVDVSPVGFGVCNFADFFITFGAVALIFILLFIGPQSAFPLKKSWREEAARIEKEREQKKNGTA